MKRREFFRIGGGSMLAAGAAAISGPSNAANFSTKPVSRTNLETIPKPAAPAVDIAFKSVLCRMAQSGWNSVVMGLAGLDLAAAGRGDDATLFAPLAFERTGPLVEFGGSRAIQPGDPAMSLLYHVLAASEALFPVLSADAYPTPAEIDAVENYIYDRSLLSDIAGLVPAVFAYEYRQAFKTPHLAHADMVFTRAGVSRTGTQTCIYDPVRREYGAPTDTGSPQDCAIVAAHFGLFLAERRSADAVDKIAGSSVDERYDVLLPVCKLVSGGRLLNGQAIQFQHSHRDEKLARLMKKHGRPEDEFCLTAPPFLRRSMGEDGPEGPGRLTHEHEPLVTIKALPGSARIFPTPRPLVRLAVQNERTARFPVPPKTKGSFSNRRYTSLKLVEDRRAEGIDAFFSDLLFRGGRPTTGLRAARNEPSFVYIRAQAKGTTDLNFLSRSNELLCIVDAGGYDAALFEDGLCDGCVTARITGAPVAKGGMSAADAIGEILPAVSFVSAPDFFPRVDPLDLARFDPMFLEGGTESVSGLRLPANPLVERPGQANVPAFPLDHPRPFEAVTLTAAISHPADETSCYTARGYARSGALNTLTDTVSNVFFPGWDMTYANIAEPNEDRFMATFGLGSPFPEDMKLCAAANGMWAGASPDAARTFYGGLEKLPLLGRPATAVPLLDAELGFHPDSPARTEWRHEPRREYGWDGEHGPFLTLQSGPGETWQAFVNCSDILLADYVRNALDGRMDLGRMQHLDNRALLDRMATLKAAIASLPRGGRPATTDMWLVSAEAVEDWSVGAEGLGVPSALAPRIDRRIAAAPGISGKGFVMLFAHCPSPSPGSPAQAGRRRFAAKRLYLCQGDADRVKHAVLDLAAGLPEPLRWSGERARRYR